MFLCVRQFTRVSPLFRGLGKFTIRVKSRSFVGLMVGPFTMLVGLSCLTEWCSRLSRLGVLTFVVSMATAVQPTFCRASVVWMCGLPLLRWLVVLTTLP